MYKIEIQSKNKLPRDTNKCIRIIAINNGCNTQVFHIFDEECGGKFNLKVNLLSRLPKFVELSQE